jgi:aminopeptidase N
MFKRHLEIPFSLILSLVFGSMLFASACSVPQPMPIASPGLDVEHYDLTLALDPATGALQGQAAINVRHSGSAVVLPLMFEGLQVSEVLVNEAPVQPDLRPGGFDVPLPDSRNASVVKVSYQGVPAQGLYREEYEGQEVVFTDSWPDRARGWFPGVHHPSDPATLTLTLDLPRGYEAVGSGAPSAPEQVGSNTRYRWTLNASAPTYTFAFAVADFAPTVTSLNGTLPIRYYMLAPDSADYRQVARTPQALDYFIDLMGPYAYQQYATVQIPLGFGGMENATAPFLRASLFDNNTVEETLVHETAHQWFGNRVVIAGWQDLWISEGMATYLTTLFYEHTDGQETAMQQWADMAVISPQRLASHTVLVPSGPVDPNEHLTWVPYEKGASVLHLLRLKLGDEAFFRTLRDAYSQYAGRPLSTEAYLDLFEQNSGTDLNTFADFWFYSASLPVLDVTWDSAAGRLSWTVQGDEGTLQDIPLMLQINQGQDLRYVPANQAQIMLRAGAPVPQVRPVGVMMEVR